MTVGYAGVRGANGIIEKRGFYPNYLEYQFWNTHQ